MTHKTHHSHGPETAKRSTSFSKTFRWHPAKPGDPKPASVAITGTFTGWQPVALHHDRATNVWQLALHHIPGNCTHHYMLLVDGQPASDKNSDGLAKPETEAEQQFALHTARGPRVFILFSNTK
jgi:hypothetical protein